ncbi:MAG TPA: hypothetical protein VH589_08475 [Trebonia sp.]|jgi:hypothetical protein
MDRSSLIVVVVPSMVLIALVTVGIAAHFTAASRSGRSHAGSRLACADALKRITAVGLKALPPEPGAIDTAPFEYLYVPCARIRYSGYPAQTRRWVQAVPIVKKTAKWIYYTSDGWDRSEAVVNPGRISREEFEADTRCRHAYPAGVIPIPGDRHRPRPVGRLFFATREAAEEHSYLERKRAKQAARETPSIRELRRAMADAHPDHGGTAEQFIEARRRYETALGPRNCNVLTWLGPW